MAISFLKHRTELENAFKSVCDVKGSIDWAIFGYDGKSYDLKVVETGEDGLAEMGDSLSPSKVQYAFCRVTDPNTDLPKLVLINWSGEGAPVNLKGTCSRHVPDVANLLRGAHVTINARSEDDVDEDEILKKVASSSGSNYSFHKEPPKPEDLGPSGPVGSVYKRTNAASEIKAKRSDDFWSKHDEDDKRRKENEIKKQQGEVKKIEASRQKSDAEAATERDRQMNEKMRSVSQQKIQEERRLEEDRKAEQARWEEKSKADSPKKQNTFENRKEAADLVSKRQNNPRDYFENKSREAAAPPPPMPRQAARAPITLPKAQEPEPEPEPEAEPEPEPAYEPEQPSEPEPPARSPEPPTRTPAFAAATPPATYRKDSDDEAPVDEAPDDEWDDEGTADAPTYENPESETAAAESYEPEPTYEDNTLIAAPAREPAEPEPLYESAEDSQAGQETTAEGDGSTATAVYDYQAGDETEITFDPGDIITEIEQIDSGWWQGRAPDGSFGMFPANYVELNE